MTPEQMKKSFVNGSRVYGSLVLSTSPKWPLSVRRTGLDFVFIDTEHIALDRTTLSWMCRMYKEIGLPPIVRIPSPSPYEACKALDGGACGVVAPYIETVEQVKQLVGATKLRPLKGEKLARALEDRSTLEPQLKEYIDNNCKDNILIINIESVPAIENLDNLLSVEGLDAILIGPHDLSNSMGIPEQYSNPLFIETVNNIISKARAHKIGVGIHFWADISLEINWIINGANLVVHSSDIDVYEQNLRLDIQKIKAAAGDKIDTSFNGAAEAI